MIHDKTAIKSNIERIQGELAGRAKLLAATKTVPPEIINYAAECGITLIGENRAGELCEKYEFINRDALDIHFIGHLQTNKVKSVIDKVSLIQSVDSLKLAAEIDKEAARINKRMDILVQVNIGEEASKFGISLSEVEEFIYRISKFDNIRLRGLMTIPPKSENLQESRAFFNKLSEKFIDISYKKVDNINIGILYAGTAPAAEFPPDILSMGMSGDYLDAVGCGSNLVRVGSAIFGERGV